MEKTSFPRYFSDWDELDKLRDRLKQIPCPHCGSIGMLNLHGALRGYTESPSEQQTFRGQRVFCSNRCRRSGCGRTASILKSTVIHGFTVSTATIWNLIISVFFSKPQQTEPTLSRRHRRILLTRLRSHISHLRSYLNRRSRPPPTADADPLVQTIHHLRTAFTFHTDPIAGFQHHFQASFL